MLTIFTLANDYSPRSKIKVFRKHALWYRHVGGGWAPPYREEETMCGGAWRNSVYKTVVEEEVQSQQKNTNDMIVDGHGVKLVKVLA